MTNLGQVRRHVVPLYSDLKSTPKVRGTIEMRLLPMPNNAGNYLQCSALWAQTLAGSAMAVGVSSFLGGRAFAHGGAHPPWSIWPVLVFLLHPYMGVERLQYY